MKKSTLFLIFCSFFVVLSIFFGYSYFTGDREVENVSQLLLFISMLILAVAMFILSRNKAFQ